ncbi:bifunctional heptose 7-phosphate kinase/heptose 1-phosphate adenyltransferase [Sulfuriroseicoccus oceanibius]|uniref:Bifunctional hydroxymethylpyrimidine kinase/phosphomethylpyrimidine kinase n=1 Tax=Sulfuriroseicoccus oceanibius TaxID=2707525 RepID=A0A6B3L6B9_9BACT|nr:PfkB family carbohydrate kinase [Sulfuriroseicoccus oceanibius]QQL45477.1 bifunctional hydroxymethylpyrimidine kinase/phosphomethylpyrimidine kinase [Sulfuriroseicoccus oceanibius]
MSPVFSNDVLVDAVSKLSSLRILVVGDVMLDVFDFCNSAESRPIDSEKPGKRAYTAHESVMTFGGAGNVATNLATLGTNASLIGLAGNDGHWHTLRAMADELAIDHCLIRDSSRPTTTKTRLYIDDEYILRKDHEASHPIGREVALTLGSEVAERLGELDAVILSDYAKGVFTPELASKIIGRCREAGVPVVVDFKPKNRELFSEADVLAPNEVEAEALLPGFKGTDQLPEMARKLRDQIGAKNLVVTLGANGICGVDAEGEFFALAGHKVEAVDAVGCGDTVRASLAIGMALGLDLMHCAALANAAAAVIVQKAATATLTAGELLDFLKARPTERVG